MELNIRTMGPLYWLYFLFSVCMCVHVTFGKELLFLKTSLHPTPRIGIGSGAAVELQGRITAHMAFGKLLKEKPWRSQSLIFRAVSCFQALEGLINPQPRRRQWSRSVQNAGRGETGPEMGIQ